MTVSELGELTGMSGNLLAHHLEVLETAGLILRRESEGDRRRRYVSLVPRAFPQPAGPKPVPATKVAFVCTHNSARSQFAAALWRHRAQGEAWSAGTEPADSVHPMAVRVAAEFGLDLSDMVPSGYDSLPAEPDLIISVCDRARESGIPQAGMRHHWSIADPVPVGSVAAFRSAFEQIRARMERFLAAGSTT